MCLALMEKMQAQIIVSQRFCNFKCVKLVSGLGNVLPLQFQVFAINQKIH